MKERPNKGSALPNEDDDKILDFTQHKVRDGDYKPFGPSDSQSNDPKIQQKIATDFEFSTLVAPFISRTEITAGALHRLRSIGVDLQNAALFFDVSLVELNHVLKTNAALRQAWDSGLGVYKVVLRRNLLQQSKNNAQIAMYLADRDLPQDKGAEEEKQKKARDTLFQCMDALTAIVLEKKNKEVESGADGTIVLPTDSAPNNGPEGIS